MVTRRDFIKNSLVASSGLLLTSRWVAAANPQQWRMPDEGELHRATWMAFGPSQEIWGAHALPNVQANLALIARHIAQFEPVNMLVREEDYELARRQCGDKVNFHIETMNDLWMRDTGPIFVKDEHGKLAALDFNFNGWGGKQDYEQDAEVAKAVAKLSKTPLMKTQLVLEGGGIEVDGEGTAIITESCVLNRNRNPNVSKLQCEIELKRLLGLSKIIWLPGIKGKDITDGHTDFYARFAGPGVVLAGYEPDSSSFDHAVTQQHLRILQNALDAKGRKLKVVVLPAPSKIRAQQDTEHFAAGYINFYVCNGAVIAPEFGDVKAESNCRSILRELFPQREIVQLNIDAIAAGGGGIHCTTQQQPN
jgi:agmatine deiminase